MQWAKIVMHVFLGAHPVCSMFNKMFHKRQPSSIQPYMFNLALFINRQQVQCAHEHTLHSNVEQVIFTTFLAYGAML